MSKGHKIPILLLRIDYKDRIEELCLNGHIYMGLVSKYHKKANNSQSELISDHYEGKGTTWIRQFIDLNPPNDAKGPNLCYLGTGKQSFLNANQCVFCMIGVEKISESEETWTLPWPEILGMLGERKVDECAVLIMWDTTNFIKRWQTEMLKRDLFSMAGFVEYDDHDFDNKHDSFTAGYALESCFHKDKRYAGQHEYRFAACANEKEDIKDLYIGKLDERSYGDLPIDEGKSLAITIIPKASGVGNAYYASWVQDSPLHPPKT